MTAHDMADYLGRAYREGRLDRCMRVYLAPKLQGVNEVGSFPLNDLGATIFLQLASARHKRDSYLRHQSFAAMQCASTTAVRFVCRKCGRARGYR